jgi:hypothetical protein
MEYFIHILDTVTTAGLIPSFGFWGYRTPAVCGFFEL